MINRMLPMFFLLFGSLNGWAQQLSGFVDLRGDFYVFDDGAIALTEFIEIEEYKVGWRYIAYVDNSNGFKIYGNGTAQEANITKPEFYAATRNFLVYKGGNILRVIDRDTLRMLSAFTGNVFAYGDSIVAYQNSLEEFEVYYNGQKTLLEYNRPRTMACGSNTLAYINHLDEFKCFWQDEIFTISTVKPHFFKAGTNTVAFVNDFDQFEVLYKGEYTLLEDYRPIRFEVGDDMVAWINNLGTFKVFYKGEIFTLMDIAPLSWIARHGLVAFRDEQGFLRVFDHGQVHSLVNYFPAKIEISGSLMAFSDQDGKVVGYKNGNTFKVSQQVVDDNFRIDGQVIRYVDNARQVHFFYNGTTYGT